MSLREEQNVLARLYTDPVFRRAFFDDPAAAASAVGLDASEAEELAAASKDEIEMFSESLVWKRLRGVEKMLPLLRRTLADSFRKTFFEFATTFNSTGVKKNLEDASEFCSFIERSESFEKVARDAGKFERIRLEFLNGQKIFAWCVVGRELGKLVRDASQTGRAPTVSVWLRTAGTVRHFLR